MLAVLVVRLLKAQITSLLDTHDLCSVLIAQGEHGSLFTADVGGEDAQHDHQVDAEDRAGLAQHGERVRQVLSHAADVGACECMPPEEAQ